MADKSGNRPTWAYTLSAAVIAFTLSAVVGAFNGGMPGDFERVLSVVAFILGAGGAIQFLMSRRE